MKAELVEQASKIIPEPQLLIKVSAASPSFQQRRVSADSHHAPYGKREHRPDGDH